MGEVRVRFPPSPTGKLHIGNARTALFNYLFARHNKGKFIFRIEDTDSARSKEEFVNDEIEALKWLGIDWDEGPDIGGEYGPYRQSERFSIYKEYVDKLLETGFAYYCFCSPEIVEEDRKLSIEKGEAPKYSGRCRNLSAEEVKRRLTNGENYSIRFKLPNDLDSVPINDLIRGNINFPLKGLDDFIIVRSDGIPTYNFAVSIDDSLMRITHILRGEDHLFGNTPRQILIYRALGFDIPYFAHFPMILGTDRTKLSKRHGAFAITDYKALGFLPEALVNYMALLGWSPKMEREFFTIDELIEKFDLSGVGVSPAIFDYEKLKWFNSYYIRQKSGKELLNYVKEELETKGLLKLNPSIDTYEKVIELSKEHFTLLTDIAPYIENIYSSAGAQKEKLDSLNKEEVKILFPLFIQKLENISEWEPEIILNLIRETGKELKIKGKNLYLPFRVAITGLEEGPEIYLVIYLLGKDKVISILKDALARL